MRTPHCLMGDHVDVFVTAAPISAERPYGPGDVHLSIDLSGHVRIHHQNPRVRGDKSVDGTQEAKSSKAMVVETGDGYLMEIALAHDETWVNPVAGAVVACSVVVTDHGAKQMMLKPSPLRGYLAVQPSWPAIELGE